jgi:asparagine synthase (glutamine-hydrolysing)
MSYRYIALFRGHDCPRFPIGPPGMSPRNLGAQADAAAIRLFTSDTTPVLDLPDGGVVIGQLFDDAGIPIIDGAQLPELRGAQMRQHIIRHCWGEYVVVQPSAVPWEFAVMHAPSVSNGLPCIYSYHQGSGFIASDISLAIQLGVYRKRVDWDYVIRFLTYPYLRTQRTALADVSELLPGSLLDLRGTAPVTEQAWTPWDFVARGNRYLDFREATISVRQAVSSVVRALASLDETVLLELSGGLDSSIIGTCLRDSTATVACSTLVTPVPGADERLYARLIAASLGVELQTENLPFECADFSFEDVADPVRPSVGPLQYAIDTVMGAVGDELMADSVFSGGGGDSVFSYLRTAAPAVDAFRERGASAGLRAIQDLATLHQCTVWRALHLSIRKLLRKPQAPFKPDMSFLAPSPSAEVPMDHPWFHAPDRTLPGDRERIFELAGNQIFVDYAPRRTRRFFRMPLLCQPVVEACLRAPSWMWISGGQNRAVARAAFADLLPAGVSSRRSKGTFMSYLGEVYRRNKGQMLEFLRDGHLHSRGMLDMDALQGFVHADQPPRDSTFTRILDLCRVENWIRQQD